MALQNFETLKEINRTLSKASSSMGVHFLRVSNRTLKRWSAEIRKACIQRAVDKARIDELEACLRGVRRAICEQSPVVIWYGPLGVTAFDEITSLLGDGESPEVDALINKSGE